MRRSLLAIAALAALAFLGISARIHSAAGGGERTAPAEAKMGVAVPARAQTRRDLAGSPPALAALHRQAGRLLESGSLGARLRRLRGYPVVLNAWASWCPPCQEELPIFAAASAAEGRRVAFLGADVEDDAGAARALLAGQRLSYPSYPVDAGALAAIAPIHGTPTTIFLAAGGGLAGVHIGAYESAAELRADLRGHLDPPATAAARKRAAGSRQPALFPPNPGG